MIDRESITDAPVTGVEHWTRKKTADGDVRLFLWEKFVGSAEGKPAVLFVHGSSMASQPTFDLQVPGHPGAMDYFVGQGFDTWRSKVGCDAIDEPCTNRIVPRSWVFCARRFSHRNSLASPFLVQCSVP